MLKKNLSANGKIALAAAGVLSLGTLYYFLSRKNNS